MRVSDEVLETEIKQRSAEECGCVCCAIPLDLRDIREKARAVCEALCRLRNTSLWYNMGDDDYVRAASKAIDALREEVGK